MRAGSLTVVGAGIQLGGHLTLAAHAAILAAEKVLYLAADGGMAEWLRQLNASAESLSSCAPGRRRLRREKYAETVERILDHVRAGADVCVVYYGHPGVFAQAPHEAIRRARDEGYEAVMHPAISAQDCLFADLGVDPAETGLQSFDATDFLIRRRRFDPRSALILWQIGMIGHPYEGSDSSSVPLLTKTLLEHYPGDHEVVVYEAALYAVCAPSIERLALTALPDAAIGERSLLWVEPLPDAAPASLEMMVRMVRSEPPPS